MFGGQLPTAQLATHHASMLAFPAHAPVALHAPEPPPPPLVVGLGGAMVVPGLGGFVTGLSVTGGSVPGGNVGCTPDVR